MINIRRIYIPRKNQLYGIIVSNEYSFNWIIISALISTHTLWTSSKLSPAFLTQGWVKGYSYLILGNLPPSAPFSISVVGSYQSWSCHQRPTTLVVVPSRPWLCLECISCGNLLLCHIGHPFSLSLSPINLSLSESIILLIGSNNSAT